MGKSLVTVTGGGIFGCTTALELSAKGFDVNLFELNDDILKGASKNNFNRVHLGYHYPRDLETAPEWFWLIEIMMMHGHPWLIAIVMVFT
jgi:L-2-hydroxyglutarate oxidase LhgO